MKKTLLLLSLLFPPLLLGATPQFEEDLHYSSVIPPQPGGEGGRIQVMEFFWYGCGGCNALEPHLQEWLKRKPENVDFMRVPAVSDRPDVKMHAKTYYALELMKADRGIHEKIFHAIHDQHQALDTPERMEKFLGEQGIDTQAYRDAMASFAVDMQIRRALILAERFDARRVPAVAVDGKYVTTGLNPAMTMQLVEYLMTTVEREKTAQASK